MGDNNIKVLSDGSVRILNGSNITILFPGQNTSSFDLEIQDVCREAWSEGVIQAYAASLAPSDEVTERDVLKLVQAILDTEASKRGYDNIISACSYAGYKNTFQPEATQLGKWRSAVWGFCYQYLADVKAGAKAMPKRRDIEDLLPIVEDYA